MSRPFPKLLVATEFPANASGGGPAVVRQMLRSWPTEALFWWSCRLDRDQRFGREVAGQFAARIPEKLYPNKLFTKEKAAILESLWSGWARRNLRAAIEKCQPDVVWAIPHQWSIPPLAAALPRSRRPFHISVHDFPDARHQEERFGKKLAARLTSKLQRLWREANSRDAISAEMASDLEQRTTRAADQVLHAGLEPEDFEFLARKSDSAPKAIKIAYAGTIVATESFGRLVESLERIRPRLARPIELHFFGAHSYQTLPWFNPAWMSPRGDLSAEALREALRDFQWGIAPMEMTDDNPRYNRYSLPTKIISYLAAGLGLVSMGHKESTVMHLARRYSFGIALDDSELERIDELLALGLSEPEPWRRYRAEIIRCARSEFDAEAMRKQLWKCLGVNGL